MAEVNTLSDIVKNKLNSLILHAKVAFGELTIEVSPEHLPEVCRFLRDDPELKFNLLLDICGVDYLHYGLTEWETESTTATGFSRGVEPLETQKTRPPMPRFATVYHLLSLTHNHRIRIRAYLNDVEPTVPSIISIWPSANWYEREAYDLFGIIFTDHPDLRRILTDYGFSGYPFRKDFPLIGKVEVRYDAKLKRVIYEKVSIEPRVLEPKVIRDDTRYEIT